MLKKSLFLLLFLFSFQVQAFMEFESLDLKTTEFIRQEQSQCVPLSFLYMLKLGTDEMNHVYDNLSGADDEAKLLSLVNDGAEQLSSRLGTSFFDKIEGTDRIVVSEWFDALFKAQGLSNSGYSSFMLHRLKTETTPGEFLRRVHQQMLSSLKSKKPIMLNAELTTTDHQKKDYYYEFAHAFVLVGVQSEINDFDLGFTVWYLDPVTGQVSSAQIYEEVSQPFNSMIFSDAETIDGEWSDGQWGVTNAQNEFISSPYLRLNAPVMGSEFALNWDMSRNLYVNLMLAPAQ